MRNHRCVHRQGQVDDLLLGALGVRGHPADVALGVEGHLGRPAGLDLGAELAGLLGGAVGCSRAVTMAGWTVYEVDGAHAPRIVLTGPPGSAAGVTVRF